MEVERLRAALGIYSSDLSEDSDSTRDSYDGGSYGHCILSRSLDLLRRCGYAGLEISATVNLAEKILMVLASPESRATFRLAELDEIEKLHIGGLSLFWAHCLVVDECCPLGIWHRKLFKSYCKNISDLNAALAVMMRVWLGRTVKNRKIGEIVSVVSNMM